MPWNASTFPHVTRVGAIASIETQEEIQSCFDKFDEDQSGDMDVIELTDLLHYMGHTTKMDEAWIYIYIYI